MQQRRQFLKLGAGSIASLLCSRAFALDYPTGNVRWIVTTAPGGTGDYVSRLIGQALTTRLGQGFIMENKPGAGGNLATDTVVRAPADGYTLLIIARNNVVNGALYENLTYDFLRDIRPVAGLMQAPLVLLINPSVPVKTLPEFLAYAKANPNAINYGSPGIGSDPHLAGEMLKKLAGIEMTHVPYRGGALAMTDLLSNHIQVMFSNLPSQDYINTGKLRGIGVSTTTPSKFYPDLPAIAEYVPGFDITGWFFLGVRTGTPASIIDKLNREVNAALAEPKIQSDLGILGGTAMPFSPAEAEKFLASETDKWTQVIRAANIKPE